MCSGTNIMKESKTVASKRKEWHRDVQREDTKRHLQRCVTKCPFGWQAAEEFRLVCWTDRRVNRAAEGQRWPCFTKQGNNCASTCTAEKTRLYFIIFGSCSLLKTSQQVSVHIYFSFQLNMLLEKWLSPSQRQVLTTSAQPPLLSIGIPSMHCLWIDLHSLPLVVSSVC